MATRKTLIKLIWGVIIIIGLVIGAMFFISNCENITCDPRTLSDTEKADKNITNTWRVYNSDALGIEFRYPPNYFLETKSLSGGNLEHFSIILTEDTEENKNVREGNMPPREGPTAITFDIYHPSGQIDPLLWVKNNSNSNFKLSNGTYDEIMIADKPAISYEWSGLYEADNIVLSHKDYITSIAVTHLAPEDKIRKDFYEIVKTLRFR